VCARQWRVEVLEADGPVDLTRIRLHNTVGDSAPSGQEG
jgi:hypothetical protein